MKLRRDLGCQLEFLFSSVASYPEEQRAELSLSTSAECVSSDTTLLEGRLQSRPAGRDRVGSETQKRKSHPEDTTSGEDL